MAQTKSNFLATALLLSSAVCHSATLEPGEQFPGGATTYTGSIDRNLFSRPAANISFTQQMDFNLGNAVFRKLWVSAPSSTTASDGLGPLYNARSCEQCHQRDGRGHPPAKNWPDDNAVSMFLRLSIPAQNEQQRRQLQQGRIGVIPEPTYGGQLQDFAITGVKAEGRFTVSYKEQPVPLSDGTVIMLQQPQYQITDLQYGPLHPQTMISPRVAPPMIGLGLLETISERDILSNEDPQDADNDGISGRANRVWHSASQRRVLGRFGWKAGNPDLDQQNNSAFNGDIGISTPSHSNPFGDCTERQPLCLSQPHGNTPAQDHREAGQAMTDLLLFYTRHLAVPERKQTAHPRVLEGKTLFYSAGCDGCHTPSFTTPRNVEFPALSEQKIWPYSDLLLHDMGDGLADSRPEFDASGREWRTPPLWGIGHTQTVSGHTRYLHDGRARNLLEAILWHGGEAETSKQQVINMSQTERDDLIHFLESL